MVSFTTEQLCEKLERLRLSDSALVLRGAPATAPSDKNRKSSTSVCPRNAEIPTSQDGSSESTTGQDHEHSHQARCQAVDMNNLRCILPVHHTGTDFGPADGDALPYHVVQDPIVGTKIVYGRRQGDSHRDMGAERARLDIDDRDDTSSVDFHALKHTLAWEDVRNAAFTDADIRDSSLRNCVAAGSIGGPVASRFKRCDLTLSTLEACEVWAGTLKDCDTTGSFLVGVTITRGTLQHCYLFDCKLEGDVQIGPGIFEYKLSHLAYGLVVLYILCADGVLR